MWRSKARRWLGVAAFLILSPLVATSADWADWQARLEYAYHTEDLKAVEALRSETQTRPDGQAAQRTYAQALGAFRAGLLLYDVGQSQAADSALRTCLKLLSEPADLDAQPIEGIVLAIACEGRSGQWNSPSVARRLAQAQQINPHHPQLLLVKAWRLSAARGAPSLLQARQAQREAWHQAAVAFLRPDATPVGSPSWGGAEAWLGLAQAEDSLGHGLLARESYEQALVLAPDFKAARSGLSSLRDRLP